MTNLGWKGLPCTDSGHSGLIVGRCADCGKRAAPPNPHPEKEIQHV